MAIFLFYTGSLSGSKSAHVSQERSRKSFRGCKTKPKWGIHDTEGSIQLLHWGQKLEDLQKENSRWGS